MTIPGVTPRDAVGQATVSNSMGRKGEGGPLRDGGTSPDKGETEKVA